MTRRLSRRTFLRNTAGTVGAVVSVPHIVPSIVLGEDGAVPPSEKTAVGFIGTGSHGTGWNLRAYLNPENLTWNVGRSYRRQTAGERFPTLWRA